MATEFINGFDRTTPDVLKSHSTTPLHPPQRRSNPAVEFKALLSAHRLSYRALAARVGVSPSHLNLIANGKRVPGMTVAYQLAHELGFTLDQLYRLLGLEADPGPVKAKTTGLVTA